jgi:hypothetical protein
VRRQDVKMWCQIARIEFGHITIHVVKKLMENSELVLVLVHQSVLVDRDVAEILLLLVLNINQSINKLCSCGFVVDMPCSNQNLKKQSFQNYYIRLIRKKS